MLAKFSKWEAQFVSVSEAKSCVFAIVSSLLPFLRLILKGQMRCPKDYESPKGLKFFVQGKFVTSISESCWSTLT